MTIRQLDELVDEILDERNDRSLVILCSSIIDEQLLNILITFFKNPIKKNEDDLLKGDNPLSTFSSRIKIIYRLGIIDNSFREILDTVRKIRNLSAHGVEVNLNKSPIKDHIQILKKNLIIRPSYQWTKERFFKNNSDLKLEIKSLFVTICVILEAIHVSIKKIKQNKKTINISIK